MNVPDPLIGVRLDGYTIVAEIGSGGMGVVYRASTAAGDVVALKLMAPELARSSEFRVRFAREAQWSLEHPHIVPVYGGGEAGGHLYIAMYLVEGEDLKKTLAREGRLSPRRTFAIFRQAALALDAAHGQGIVHRDVKPQNILLEARSGAEQEHVYLSDFGLVKRVAAESSFTSTSHLIGTAQYISPEQIRGQMIDGRTDVYALGCVAYEALTGQVPYPQEEEVAVLWAHVHEPPPEVSTHVPVLPDAVDEVIAKAMAKSPPDRYLTAGDFANALGSALGISGELDLSPRMGEIISASSARRRRDARLAASATTDVSPTSAEVASSRGFLVGVAATIAVLLGLLALTSDSARDVASSTVAMGRELIADLVDGPAPETSPGAEGRLETTTRRKSNDIGARLVDPAAGDARGISRALRSDVRERPTSKDGPGAGGDRSDGASVPSDGRPIVFSEYPLARTAAGVPQDGFLTIIDPDGSNGRLLYDQAGCDDYDPAYSPDGSRVVFSSCGRLRILTLDDSAPMRSLPCPGMGCGEAAWSPDGKRLVFAVSSDDFPNDADSWSLWTIGADGSKPRELYDGPRGERTPSWSPNGRWLAFSTNTEDGDDVLLFDVRSGKVGELLASPQFERWPKWSPDGRLLAYSRGRTPNSLDVWVLDARTGRRWPVTSGPNHSDQQIDWSPSGRWLTFTRYGDVNGGQIFKVEADGTGSAVSVSSGNGHDPTW